MSEKPDKFNKQEAGAVISLEEDASLPDDYGLERYLEEINILELEGVYFSPSRKQAGQKQAGHTVTRIVPLRELAERPVTIVLSEYGQPSERAYKVLQAGFLKLSEQRYDTDGWVSFSRRELARLLGCSEGGRQLAELYKAIKQLQKTEVICSVKFKEKREKGYEKR